MAIETALTLRLVFHLPLRQAEGFLQSLFGLMGATVVVPPDKTARVSRRGPRSRARDRTIKKMKTVGRRRWKQEVGDHRQARVENAFFRFKSSIDGSLRARSPGGRAAEAVIACNVLNQMTERGRPESYSVGR